MGSDKNTSQVVFFLGAGASVKAGVPDTYSFVKEFRESITDQDKIDTVDKIINTLKQWKGLDIDVELLLETLSKLDAKEEEALLRFFKGGRFILSGYSEKEPIIKDLKDFIKAKAIIKSEDQIKYLEPLLGFVEEFRPLDIISVNYDTCLEQFCNVNKLNYQDGFDVHWNPKSFEVENTDIRLYKLHGSVMWYRSDRGGYIKIPVMTEESSIELITGEKAESLMLYPMQKWNYAEPLLELLVKIKHRLEFENCELLIVVGYSFRDDHIMRILWDVTRKNRNLNIIIIDPKAFQIYSEKLKYYDKEKEIPSSLDGKVVCLPYKFEEVFPYLKDHYLKNYREGLNCTVTQRQSELKGEKANWIGCLKPLINAEHTEKVEEVLKKVEHSERNRDWQLSLELPLRMGLNLAANGQDKRAQKYFKILKEQLYLMFVERLDIEISQPMIEFRFNCIRTPPSADYQTADYMYTFIENLSQYIESRRKMVTGKIEQIESIKGVIDKIKNYLESFSKGGLNLDKYIQLRKNEVPHIEDIIGVARISENLPGLNKELAAVLTEKERNILKKIIL